MGIDIRKVYGADKYSESKNLSTTSEDYLSAYVCHKTVLCLQFTCTSPAQYVTYDPYAILDSVQGSAWG